MELNNEFRECTLHEVGMIARRRNSINKNRYGKKYEDLIGLTDIYVTTEGLIYDDKTLRPIKMYETPDGYLIVSIGGKTFFVHRIVALAFCDNIFVTDKVVCHKNKDRKDNRSINLLWTDRSYIAERRVDFSKPNRGRRITAIRGSFIKTYDDAGKIEKELGVQRGNIYKVCKGLRKTAGGYKFKYADKNKR